MKLINEMSLTVKAISLNESFVRSAIAAFCVTLNPTLDEITEIKTAVSEAVTNCVVHAYPNKIGEIFIKVKLYEKCVEIEIKDNGVGIDNIEQALQPFFTTKPEQERSGMGFTVMESFMDKLNVVKNSDGGITVRLTKKLGKVKREAIGG
jgi:stage II sporulation protein AB (anti-sigma F factor)